MMYFAYAESFGSAGVSAFVLSGIEVFWEMLSAVESRRIFQVRKLSPGYSCPLVINFDLVEAVYSDGFYIVTMCTMDDGKQEVFRTRLA